jgi:hypothetical protein
MSINNEKVRMHRLPIYRVALVRETSQPSILNCIKTPRNVFEIAATYLEGADREHFVVMMLDGTVRAKNNYIYNIIAKANDSKLLPVDERTFIIPKASKNSGGIGQCGIWYAEGEKNEVIKEEVINYITNYGVSNNKAKRITAKRQVDVESKINVETNAINIIQVYYEELGYTVTDVQGDNVGWDLEAEFDNRVLKIEVKGLSGNEILVNLTPNEYEKMKINYEDYRLCIVTNDLNPELRERYIFLYNEISNRWMDNEGKELIIEEKIAAKMYIK